MKSTPKRGRPFRAGRDVMVCTDVEGIARLTRQIQAALRASRPRKPKSVKGK